MCGIAGFISPQSKPEDASRSLLNHMNRIQRHRGPDDQGVWLDPSGNAGLSHVRLSILDLSPKAHQPMISKKGNAVTYNGEIYNFRQLREELGADAFETHSDTEVILRAYEKWGEACVERFRGMFAFALWDAERKKLFIARDRFGIKPFYYTFQHQSFYFASEIKTLLPWVESPKVNLDGLRDYLTFQFCLGEKTLYEGIRELKPAHTMTVDLDLNMVMRKYWEVHYDLDWSRKEPDVIESVRQKFFDSVQAHMTSDVEVGAYLSGGTDSSLIASCASGFGSGKKFQVFTGKFSSYPDYDESRYARMLTCEKNLLLHEVDITAEDFENHISKVIYHLDQPTAGPGSFAQYMVSREVKKYLKVVLGGQGGDEIFGGYIRYLIAYFEQCLKGAIDGSMNSGNFIVTYESIIPNLQALENYKPLLQEFWSEGIFDSRDKRYFRLIDRSRSLRPVLEWDIFGGTSSWEDFKEIYWGKNVGKESYFDSMTHFDFKTLLPALLHVEDRMSMAHGVESRVPFLDHDLVELLAVIPSNIKFQNGELKRLLRTAFSDKVPNEILSRKDKMGFPVPIQRWLIEDAKFRGFVMDLFKSSKAKTRFYLTENFDVETLIKNEPQFGRNLWALLCLELWQQQFIDTSVKTSALERIKT